MDKERLMKEAAEFIGVGSCYIHAEMKNHKAPQILIGGDILSMMWTVGGIIKRIAEKTGHTFEDTCGMIFNIPKFGYDEITKAVYKDNIEFRYIEGEDWQEKWKAEKEKEIKREANLDNISLAFNLSEMEKRCTSLNNQLVDLKKDYTKNLKAKDDQIKNLTKECQALEHRMKEMEQHTLLPGGDEEV